MTSSSEKLDSSEQQIRVVFSSNMNSPRNGCQIIPKERNSPTNSSKEESSIILMSNAQDKSDKK